MSALKDRLRSLLPTDNPNQAAQGPTGERLAQKPPPKERADGDFIPVIAVLVGMAILTITFLRPIRLPSPANLEPSEETTDSYASEWPSGEQGY